MNKTAIKNFAIWARVNLIESAKQRAYEYEIIENGSNNASADIIGGRPLSKDEKEQRTQLINQINAKGFNQVMEEAAYTWFNRFIALRFMEVNGYLPTRIRVFSNEEGEFKPEILKEAMTVELDGLDRDKVLDLLDKQDNEALYKMLLIAQCNALSDGLPYMFEKIANWTELLFPANLLKGESVIGQMVSSIPEEDWTDAVQIIGWLYQYYNSELKDETFALLKKNVKITKERIPAATQLFTPDWIVRYMVENSLGRIYIQRKLVNSGDWLVADEATKISMEKKEAEAMGWKYYLSEAEQEPEVRKQLMEISNTYTSMKVEDIKVIDPCMGSGHILVYAFDVLMQIYTASGWSERDAAKSIIENNIYGLDIDDRAGQLAYFAVMMKARKYNRRILSGSNRPNVMAIQDSSFMTDELVEYVAAGNKDIKSSLNVIRTALKDAKEYGSILDVKPVDATAIYLRIDEIAESTPENIFALMNKDLAVGPLYSLVKQAEIMGEKYAVVTTNPPYMGGSGMSAKLANYIKSKYPDSKADLFSVFIEKCGLMLDKSGYQAMITQHSWMFLSSYEKLRSKILRFDLINTIHLGARAFEEIGGEVVQTVSFILGKQHTKDYKGTYCRLVDELSQDAKETAFLSSKNLFTAKQTNFVKIPGNIYGYWITDKVFQILSDSNKLDSFGSAKQGLATTDNKLYLRLWQEVKFDAIDFECDSCESTIVRGKKWYPYNKAGSFRKWSSINEYVVNYENDGSEIKNSVMTKYPYLNGPGFVVKNTESYFRHGITWNDVSTGTFCCRYVPDGFIYDAAGPMYFSDNDYLMMGYFNSKVFQTFADIICQGLHYSTGHIPEIPYIQVSDENKAEVEKLVAECLELSNADWDSFENSWNFKSHPLIQNVSLISEAYEMWEKECNTRFEQLKRDEIRLNEIFINIYGLEEEISADIDDSLITVRRADLERDIRGLISYAVGCMFGRYSLDTPGLTFAGGIWDDSKYRKFIPDKDNIIPICDDEYFNDDIVSRFVEFIKVVYGEANLEKNLKFISNALGGKGSSRETIRLYFLNEFYKDHCNIYSVTGSGKRPIYWLFDSGKKNGFKCLIYMHRYKTDILARIRTDYVHELQSRYRTAISDMETRVERTAGGEKVKFNKELLKLKDQDTELRKYEELIHHYADQMIEFDLDDGFKVNYALFQDVLSKVK